ncbi:hypothetical protein GQ54DRAFT_144908, partial [Martensiomyces pterosporus]
MISWPTSCASSPTNSNAPSQRATQGTTVLGIAPRQRSIPWKLTQHPGPRMTRLANASSRTPSKTSSKSAISQATQSTNWTTSTRTQTWVLSNQARQKTTSRTMRMQDASGIKTTWREPTTSVQSQRYLPAAITSFPPSSQRTLRSQKSSVSYNGASSMPASKTPTRLNTAWWTISSSSSGSLPTSARKSAATRKQGRSATMVSPMPYKTSIARSNWPIFTAIRSTRRTGETGKAAATEAAAADSHSGRTPETNTRTAATTAGATEHHKKTRESNNGCNDRQAPSAAWWAPARIRQPMGENNFVQMGAGHSNQWTTPPVHKDPTPAPTTGIVAHRLRNADPGRSRTGAIGQRRIERDNIIRRGFSLPLLRATPTRQVAPPSGRSPPERAPANNTLQDGGRADPPRHAPPERLHGEDRPALSVHGRSTPPNSPELPGILPPGQILQVPSHAIRAGD